MSESLIDLNEQPEIDENKDYLAELVGPGKKYVDYAALAKGYANADRQVNRVQTEAQELRAELKTRKSVQEFIDKMNETKNGTTITSSTSTEGNEHVDNQSANQDIDAIVDAKLAEREQIRRKQENLNAVKRVLAETIGSDNVNQFLIDKAKELQVNAQWLDDMAKTTPQALLKLLDIGTKKQEQPSLFQAPPQGTRTSTSSQSSGVAKNFKYFNELRRKDKTSYYSPAIQNEMLRIASEMGEDFYKQ